MRSRRGRIVAAAATAAALSGALTACTAGATQSPATQETEALEPTPGADADPIVIQRADFQIRYRLEGITRDSDTVALTSNPQLTFVSAVPDGQSVDRGQTLGAVMVEPEVRAGLESGATTSRLAQSRLDRLLSLESDVRAPVGGILRGSSLASVGIDVVVDLTPIQGLRYQSLSFSGRATVETVVGEREVACEAVWAEPGTPGELGAAEGADVDATASQLHCRLPAHVETAAGLRAQLALESEAFPDVVVVPNIYVGYDTLTDGYVITVDEDGTPRTIPVDVGVTDGVVRVITSEVPIGATLVAREDPTG